jgi:hypothetical protein
MTDLDWIKEGCVVRDRDNRGSLWSISDIGSDYVILLSVGGGNKMILSRADLENDYIPTRRQVA